MKHYFKLLFLLLSFYCCAYAQENGEAISTEDTLFFNEQDVPAIPNLCTGVNANSHPLQRINDSEDISKLEVNLSAECEPITTVAGCVSVSSGHFFQVEQDIIGNTVDPISLTRYYDSESQFESFIGLGFGSQFPLLATDTQKSTKHSHALISERDGFLIPYQDSLSGQHKMYQIDPRLLQKGYTNLSRAAVSGHSNYVNWRAIHCTYTDRPGTYWMVQLGNGTQRKYGRFINISRSQRQQMGFPTKDAYLLTEEIKPNGNKLEFSYHVEGKPYLTKVRTRDRSGTVLNELNMTYLPTGCLVESSCGYQAFYSQKLQAYKLETGIVGLVNKKVLNSVASTQKGATIYTSESESFELPRIVKVEKPMGRFIEIKYNEDRQVIGLKEPLGLNGEAIATYTFQYEKDYTRVFNALKQLTTYHFDSSRRLSHIDYLSRNHIIKQECFEWSKGPGQEGWLKAKSIQLNGEIFHRKAYDYDERGNVICETFYGNLTGEKPQSFTRETQMNTDKYSIHYQYSQDSRNLLIKKITPEGLEISYEYLPGTNLCTKELYTYNGRIQERTFRSYDSCGQVIKLIEDNGSREHEQDLKDVSFRRITDILPVGDPAAASFGKPLLIVESYLQDSQQLPLKKIEFAYDSRGNEISQKIYNAQSVFCYEITKAYDLRGRLIQESNALGQVTRYVYDEANNKIEEELIGSGKILRFTYDFGNRLVRKEECLSNGEILATSYVYNALHQLVAEKDSYGNEMHYHYDRLGHQVACIKPAMIVNGQVIQPAVAKQYNMLGQVIVKTDENGFSTHFTYNAYGKPTQIIHPDGSMERLTYYPCGWLKQRWKADGTSTHYIYDPKGRVLNEITYDVTGAELKKAEYIYKGPLLKVKKDSMGLQTTYCYDGAGRKISEVVGQVNATSYEYDGFGRIIKKFQALDAQNGQAEIYAYDWLDRIISKTWQDNDGHVYGQESYEYDINGNQIKKSVWHSDDKVATYYSQFDSAENLIAQTDPHGEKKTWTYNNHFINVLGQQVQCRSIEDQLNRRVLEADDAFHRLVRKDICLEDNQLSSTHWEYDAAGHLIKQHTVVTDVEEGKYIRDYTILNSYNSRGLLISETELPHGKITLYTYDTMGRLISKRKPDGVFLYYTYDALGRLKELKSTDGTIAYAYTYDLHDNPIEIRDLVHGITQKRTYDLLSRLITEEVTSGAIIAYSYDALNRITKMTLPDHSYVSYVYDAFHLKKVQRFDASGTLQYEYECQAYDMTGHLVKGCSPAGTADYEYDLLGRLVAIKTPHFESYLEQFDPVGNLLAMKQVDPSGEVKEQFAYNRFNHLTQESGLEKNEYKYDSLGNCLNKNGTSRQVNDLNQVTCDGDSEYTYDSNGNLIMQTNPAVVYTYDALNRLIQIEQAGSKTSLIYDALGRCIQITDNSGTKQLLYQGDKEIGSLFKGKLHELRLMHPKKNIEATFAIELQGKVFFPIQDYRYNICALQRQNGTIAQWYRHLAFEAKDVFSDNEEISLNPWRFANRREVAGLIMFTHRFYNPKLMRWMTTDPIGFADSLNLYLYVRNNPFYYLDPDGRVVFAIPIAVFGPEGVALVITGFKLIAAVATCAVGWAAYNFAKSADDQVNQHLNDAATKEEKGKKKKYREDNFPGTDKDLEENPDWKETTHPKQREAGHREFVNEETGEKVRFDKGDPTLPETKHGHHDHYHRYNPDGEGKGNLYLDADGNPVPRNHDTSHLYPPEGTSWYFN